MFNLDNFDLDIDDDFSSNIFSNAVTPGTKNTVEKEESVKVFEISSNTASKCEIPRNKRLREQTNLGNTIWSDDIPGAQVVKESRENTLKRSWMPYEKPQKKRFSTEGLLQRKFPGPAGLLPDKPFKEISDVSLLVEKQRDDKDDERDMEDSVVYSQCSGSVFQEPSYQKLLSDFNLNESKNPLNKYTVEWLKRTALNKGLQGKKIPFLGLIVHSVRHTMPDPVVVLRDPTGEIHGSLHREIWIEMGGKLKAGIALALRQVGVLMTGVIRRQIYLNITMNNILALYSPCENENQVEIATVNKISKAALLKSLDQWLPQPPAGGTTKIPSNRPLFATADDLDLRLTKTERMTDLKKSTESFVGASKEKRAMNGGGRKTEEGLADLGIVLTDCDFEEEMRVPQAGTSPDPAERGTSGRTLSRAESLIFEEVLSGINFDEFEA